MRPRRARRKSEGERRRARRQAFRRYFADASTWTVQRSRLLPDDSTKAALPLPPGLLVGLRDRTRHDRGLGIILDSDPFEGLVTLFTPVSREQAVSFCLGELTLDRDFRERRIEIGSEPGADVRWR